MVHSPAVRAFGLLATLIVVWVSVMTAASDDSRVADAAMRGNLEMVRALVKQADINGAQGDGMT
ncbi:MAG: hypothetical protein EHM89_08030, partial [Acidobacteria bacterium]